MTKSARPVSRRPVLRHYVLGVDSGSSKTVALVAGCDGHIVGAGRGGPGDIYEGEAAAFDAVRTAVGAALAEAGLTKEALQGSVFSMSGADWPEDFALIRATLERDGFAHVRVVNDAIGALYAGLPRGFGVTVACGTGAATGSRGPGGEWHSSWWQGPGGGGDLSIQTLRAVCRAELGIDPPTSLTKGVLGVLGLPTVEAALYEFTKRDRAPTARLTRLTRVLLGEAEAGDATARGIVETHGRALGDYALAAARRVGLGPESQPYSLVLAGGVLRHPSSALKDALVNRVLKEHSLAEVVKSRFEPAVGALIIALQESGVEVDAPLLDTLTATSPPEVLFET